MARVRLEIFDNILTMEKGYVAYIYLRFHNESDFAFCKDDKGQF